MTTQERINRLSEERSRLYRRALGVTRPGPELKERIGEITLELERLWEVRRRERVGKLDGIDLLVEQSYARIYGDGYRDAVAPPAVEDEREREATLAA